jgi:multiple sugar transport system ATP-binding protein
MTMSDRIAVMMAGNIVQVGTPDEVYNRPQDIRVAEFIGSPKINILPGRVEADGRVRVLGLALDQRLDAPSGTPVQVGIRPEALRPAAVADGAWRGTVSHVENLGSEVFVHAAVAGLDAPVLCRFEPGEARTLGVGSPVALVPKPATPSFFDAEGRRLGARPVAYRQVVNG